jgi:hypothetical protein
MESIAHRLSSLERGERAYLVYTVTSKPLFLFLASGLIASDFNKDKERR